MFTSEENELIEALRAHAEKNILSLDDVKQALRGDKKPVGDDANHVIRIGQFRVVFSIEDQGAGRGVLRHLSLTQSVQSETFVTGTARTDLIEALSKKLGMYVGNPIVRAKSWIEPNTPFGNAINILQEVPSGDELLRKNPAQEQMHPLPT